MHDLDSFGLTEGYNVQYYKKMKVLNCGILKEDLLQVEECWFL